MGHGVTPGRDTGEHSGGLLVWRRVLLEVFSNPVRWGVSAKSKTVYEISKANSTSD